MNIYTTLRTTFVILVQIGFLSLANAQSATASGEFTLQGKLTTTAGTPIADGQHSLTLNVYAKGSANAMFSETDNVTTIDGLFSTLVGDNGTSLSIDASTDYEIGVTVDGQAELTPRISLSSSLKSITADLAVNAEAVDGFSVSLSSNPQPNTLLVLDANGKIDASVLAGGIVSSVNGASGNVNITGGGDLAVNTSGNNITLSFTGSGGGALNFPFSKSLDLAAGSVFSISNTLAGTAATFTNTGLGAAVEAIAMTGAAIEASSSGSIDGAATIEVENTAGTAINAVSNASGDAVFTLQNLSTNASAELVSALNANGNAVFEVAATGQTSIDATVDNALEVSTTTGTAINAVTNASADAAITVQNLSSAASAKLMTAINSSGSAVLDVAATGKTTLNSTVADALEVSTSAVGSAALKVTGGLKLNGPAGTGTIGTGQTQVTINNVFASANSIILVTVNGGGVNAVPLRILSQSNGSFVVSVFNGTASLLGDVTFNYLIIN